MPRLRPPFRLITGVLVGVLVLLTTTLLGTAPAVATPEATHRSAATRGFDTDLTLLIAKCEGCVVTVRSYDGINAIFSTAPATVIGGTVTFTVPSSSTAGLSVRIQPPWLTSPVAADTHVVWRYSGKEIGDSVSFKEARSKKRASGCWAGTVNPAVTLTVKVRKINYRGRPGAIAWAPTTESYTPPMERTRSGVLVNDDVIACSLYS